MSGAQEVFDNSLLGRLSNRIKKLEDVLREISDEGWYAHSNNAAQLVEILDEHKRSADEALGINESNVDQPGVKK